MTKQDMSLPSNEFLLSVINDRYKRNFTFKQLYFGEREDTSKYNCDSLLPMHALPGGTFTGTVRAYYNRVPIDSFLEGKFLVVDWKEYFDTDDLIMQVLIQFGINLDRSDVVSDIIDEEAIETKIRISSRSLVYSGHVPVYFRGHPDSLDGSIKNRLLGGFDKDHIKQTEV